MINGDTSLSYRFTPLFSSGVFFTTSYNTFENGTDSRVFAGGLTGTYRFSPAFTVDARAGASHMKETFTSGLPENTNTSPYGALSLIYSGRDFRAALSGTIEQSGGGNLGVTTRRESVSLSVSDQFATRWWADLTGTYQVNRSLEPNVSGDLTSATGTAGVRYQAVGMDGCSPVRDGIPAVGERDAGVGPDAVLRLPRHHAGQDVQHLLTVKRNRCPFAPTCSPRSSWRSSSGGSGSSSFPSCSSSSGRAFTASSLPNCSSPAPRSSSMPQRVPENYVRSTVSTRIEDRLATIRQQVMSRTRLVAVMEELGLFKEERKKHPVEEVVEMMRKRITIEVRQQRRLHALLRPRKPADGDANHLAPCFLFHRREPEEPGAAGGGNGGIPRLTTAGDEEEAGGAGGAGKAVQVNVSWGNFRRNSRPTLQVMSRLQDQLRANADAIRTAQDRKMFTETQVNSMELQISALEAQARAASLNNPGQAPAESISPGDPAAGYAAELNLKKTQLANLSAKYTDKYPEIRRLKDEIAQLEKRVAEARGTSPAAPRQRGAGESFGDLPPRLRRHLAQEKGKSCSGCAPP